MRLYSVSCRGRGEMCYYYRSFMALGVTCLKKSLNSVCCISECLVARSNSAIASSHQFLLPLVREKDILP